MLPSCHSLNMGQKEPLHLVNTIIATASNEHEICEEELDLAQIQTDYDVIHFAE